MGFTGAQTMGPRFQILGAEFIEYFIIDLRFIFELIAAKTWTNRGAIKPNGQANRKLTYPSQNIVLI